MAELDGQHGHLYASIDHQHLDILVEIDVIDARLNNLEQAPLLHTLFGATTYPPRAGRSELEEFAYLESDAALGRGIDLRYTFSSSLPTSYSSSPMVNDSDCLSLWSFKAFPSGVIAGTLDQKWMTFLGSIPIDGKKRRIIYYQEPSDNMSGANYVAAFDRLRQLNDNENVLLGTNLSSWDFDTANTNANGEAYIHPKADFVGISLFSNSTNPNTNRNALGRAARAVNSFGIPFGLTSVGVSSQQNTTHVLNWFTYLEIFATAQRVNGHPLDHIVCYSSNISPAGWAISDWYMDGSATTLQGWRDLVDTIR